MSKPDPGKPLSVHLVTHNHWDREWIFTARYTNRWLTTFFRNLFAQLERGPEYRFVLDGQTLIIEDYLSQLSPREAAQARERIADFAQRGQLMLGPAYLQPDWSLVSGEALVRNLLIGREMALEFGPTMQSGWLLDNFGQIAQTPQIFANFGIKGAFVWRGVEMPARQMRTEFWWESPDGSRILAIYLLDSYRNAMVLALTRSIATERIHTHAAHLKPFASTGNVLLMNGYEQVPVPDDVLPIIAEFNRVHGAEMHARQSTPDEYLDAVLSEQPELPTLRDYMYSGRYAPVLRGVYSARSNLNQRNNGSQVELERWAEPFSTIAWSLGHPMPGKPFRSVWKTLLVNHTHDDVCGCCVDPIARDMIDRYNQVDQAAGGLFQASAAAITRSIDTRFAQHGALVLLNPSSRPRTEVVGFRLSLPEHVRTLHLTDESGRPVAVQASARNGDNLELYLLARDIPALGYLSFAIQPGPGPEMDGPKVLASEADHSMENDYLRVQINTDGTLDLYDKIQRQFYQGLAVLQNEGDCGDTYDYSYPAQDEKVSSTGADAQIRLEEAGPLLARFRIDYHLELPASLNEDRSRRADRRVIMPVAILAELSAVSRHLELRIVLENRARDHRLRIRFPTGIETDYSYSGAPFDLARMPICPPPPDPSDRNPDLDRLMLAGRYTAPVNSLPFQHLVSLVGGDRGLSIFSRGLSEFEILEDRSINLTMQRSVGWLARNDLLTRDGDVGPHIFTPEAQELGPAAFYLGIYPHGPSIESAHPASEVDRLLLKLRAVQCDSHPGSLPPRLEFAAWEQEQPAGAFKLTALKPGEDNSSIVMRFWNTLDRPATAALRFDGPLRALWRSNLAEENLAEIHAEDDLYRVSARPKEIVTLCLQFESRSLIQRFHGQQTRFLYPLEPLADLPALEPIPVVTSQEVENELLRAARLYSELQAVRSEAFVLMEEIELAGQPDLARTAALQRLKGREATLTRQHYESRISALLNQQLFITRQMESELHEIGEAVSRARTRKRAGEFLIHYYDRLLKSEAHPAADSDPEGPEGSSQ